MRKNLLRDLVAAGDQPSEPAAPPGSVEATASAELTAVNSRRHAAPSPAAPLGSRGAVGAMSRALAQMSSSRDAASHDVVDLDTASVIDSDFRDRLESAGTGRAALVESIRDAGQQVPILVRPAPRDAGKYQVAYGHRRVAALRELGRPVRALVRALTDDEMIVAQGAENNARKDLSFIERSHFAWSLENRGVDRGTIMAALSVDKTELSRLISVMRSVPTEIVEWVGPAPKAGRRRWMDLAQRVGDGAALDEARRFTQRTSSNALEGSDERFSALFSALAPVARTEAKPWTWTDEAGRRLGRVERARGRLVLSIDEALEPAFGDYLIEQLPALLRSFRLLDRDKVGEREDR